MSRRRKAHDEVVGQDSFLDIIANLVGIMIILVMVVGARTKDALVSAENATQPTAPVTASITAAEVESARAAEKNVEQDIHLINTRIQQQEIEIAYRQSERDRAQLLVTAAEQAIAKERDLLDETKKREFDLRNEVAAAKLELGDLHQGIDFLASKKPETTVLEHLPTPMAKTVFGKELHLRLQGGRLSYVPWDEFVHLLKEDAPKKVWRLQDQEEFTELIGPISGFWMRYSLKRQTQSISTKLGVAVQQSVVLDKFTLTPESDDLGERIADALQPNSQFQTLLATYKPDSTTITVWTYPDSFGEFRKLKQELFNRGYVTAARPLPADHPIGGSPEGTRSSAQ